MVVVAGAVVDAESAALAAALAGAVGLACRVRMIQKCSSLPEWGGIFLSASNHLKLFSILVRYKLRK